MKKIDFTKLEMETLSGVKVPLDIKRDLANGLYMNGKDIESHLLGKRIYETDGEIELEDKDIAILETYIPQFYQSYLVRETILSQLKNNE